MLERKRRLAAGLPVMLVQVFGWKSESLLLVFGLPVVRLRVPLVWFLGCLVPLC